MAHPRAALLPRKVIKHAKSKSKSKNRRRKKRQRREENKLKREEKND
ncbi:hypothetical protein [Limosilactobacillus reuteri]|nr:hypothetical protein [Limosilactobacillus reuteri]MDN4486542.1 hypothetical protein [Limosilactobacillus reuteri]